MITAIPTAAKEKLSNQSVDNLQDMAKTLMTRFDEGAGDVLDWVLEELEQRMTEKDFILFCESL